MKPVIRYWKADDDAKGGLFSGSVALSTHLPKEVGMTQTGTQELMDLFGGKAFSFPKPSDLVQHLIGAATYAKRDAIVLDSFAGSGTTAQAVLQQNAADGGRRRFVLIEMEGYAERLTAERARRVMAKGLGGAFDFCRLGEPLVEADGGLNGRASEAARCVVYADVCTASAGVLAAAGVTFKKIPRGLERG